jgi:hypothetical protein
VLEAVQRREPCLPILCHAGHSLTRRCDCRLW